VPNGPARSLIHCLCETVGDLAMCAKLQKEHTFGHYRTKQRDI